MKRSLRSFLRRRTLVCLLALAAAGVLALALRTPKAIETGSWGLSFRSEGSAPLGTVSQQVLKSYDAAYVGNTEEKVIYLTFDAGYEAGYTEIILDTLQKHEVPAAFFLVGNYLEQEPELVRRMVSDGHTVGNHTYHHYDMSKISDPAAFEKELRDLEDRFQSVTGQTLPKYYRPPQGIYSEENLKMAQSLGYKTVFWSLAYVDWEQNAQPTAQQAFDKLIPRIHDGCILLLHSTSKTNSEILDELLTRYKALGYRFGTLDELFAQSTPSKPVT